MKGMLIGVVLSVLVRSLFGLPDIISPIELSFAIGGFSVNVGLQDLLIGLIASILVTSFSRAESPGEARGSSTEATLAQRQERAYLIYQNIGVTVFGLAFLGGAFAFSTGLRSGWTGWKSKSWPVVDGQVTESTVTFTSRVERHEIDSRTPNETVTRTHETFFPSVKYVYELEGRSLTGTQISLSDVGSSSDAAKAMVAKYPVGTKVKVFYNPANTSEAVLVPGIATGSVVSVFLGGIWCTCCLIATKVLVLSEFAKQMVRASASDSGIRIDNQRVGKER